MEFLTCGDFFNNTSAAKTFVSIVGVAVQVVRVLQILVPVALIVWGTIDIGKAVIAGDEKKIKEAQKPFVKRIIAAVIVFLIPWLVGLVLGLAGGKEWKSCWKEAYDGRKGISDLGGESRNPMLPEKGD